jgi:hypothetical protein
VLCAAKTRLASVCCWSSAKRNARSMSPCRPLQVQLSPLHAHLLALTLELSRVPRKCSERCSTESQAIAAISKQSQYATGGCGDAGKTPTQSWPLTATVTSQSSTSAKRRRRYCPEDV